jgi:hypothetical protein
MDTCTPHPAATNGDNRPHHKIIQAALPTTPNLQPRVAEFGNRIHIGGKTNSAGVGVLGVLDAANARWGTNSAVG